MNKRSSKRLARRLEHDPLDGIRHFSKVLQVANDEMDLMIVKAYRQGVPMADIFEAAWNYTFEDVERTIRAAGAVE